MKPFLLFAGYDFHPQGGWKDYQSRYATLEEAKAAANEHLLGYDWVEIACLDVEPPISFYPDPRKDRLQPWQNWKQAPGSGE